MVARLMAAMGGPDAIGSIRTLSLEGRMTRSLPGGRETVATVKTVVKFPGMYRQELELPTGTVTTLIGPSGGWIVTGREAPLPLPTERRLEIENVIMRNPVALLKTRQSELFSATASKSADAGGSEVLLVSVGTKETRITLDERGLIKTMTYDVPGTGSASAPRLTVHYSDYRSIGPVQYPFASKAESENTPMYRVELKSVRANEPLAGTLFEPAKPGAIR